jgi:lysophospholipase L1-like esterase
MCARPLPARAALAAAALLAACGAGTAGAPADGLPPELPPDLWASLEPPPPPPRAVFFGSSTTAGAGASRPERRWTSIVARRLGWVEVNRGLSTSTLTSIGRRTPSGEQRWREAIAGPPADAVSVMYGANDVLARVPLGDPATPGTFRHAAAAVLRGLREALPAATLVVCAPQPSLATAAERAPYDLALAEAARAAGASFVPAGTAFPEERLPELTVDRLHLNDAGHAAVAEFVLAHRGRLFERSGTVAQGASASSRAP